MTAFCIVGGIYVAATFAYMGYVAIFGNPFK